jgi:hypothetical protein
MFLVPVAALALFFGVTAELRAQACFPAPSGLVAWWPAEGNATDVADGNPGTLTNGAAFAAGHVGQSFSFDGIDDFVSIANSPSLDFGTGGFTIELWFNLNSLSADAEMFHKVIGLVPNDQTYFLEFGIPNSLRFMVRQGASNQNDFSVLTSLVTGRWYHLAAVRDVNTSTIYLDGVSLGSQTSGTNVDSGSGGSARIGEIAPNGVAVRRPFPGQIDELSLYDRALSAGEIGAIFDAGSAGKCKVTTVEIDIEPGSFPNSINPRSKRRIPVAILTTDATDNAGTFDAATVDPTTVLFGATGTEAAPVRNALEDVDGDGDTDMILHFNTQDAGIHCGDTSATLTGKTFDGQAIKGTDAITTVGCR